MLVKTQMRTRDNLETGTGFRVDKCSKVKIKKLGMNASVIKHTVHSSRSKTCFGGSRQFLYRKSLPSESTDQYRDCLWSCRPPRGACMCLRQCPRQLRENARAVRCVLRKAHPR